MNVLYAAELAPRCCMRLYVKLVLLHELVHALYLRKYHVLVYYRGFVQLCRAVVEIPSVNAALLLLLQQQQLRELVYLRAVQRIDTVLLVADFLVFRVVCHAQRYKQAQHRVNLLRCQYATLHALYGFLLRDEDVFSTCEPAADS